MPWLAEGHRNSWYLVQHFNLVLFLFALRLLTSKQLLSSQVINCGHVTVNPLEFKYVKKKKAGGKQGLGEPGKINYFQSFILWRKKNKRTTKRHSGQEIE